MSAVRLVFAFLMSTTFGFSALAAESTYEFSPPVVGKPCGKFAITLADGQKISGVIIPEKYDNNLKKVKGGYVSGPNGQKIVIRAKIPGDPPISSAWNALTLYYVSADPETMKANERPGTREFVKACKDSFNRN